MTDGERLALLEKKVDHIIEILGIKSFKKESQAEDETPPPLPPQQPLPHRIPAPPPLPKFEKPSISYLPILAVICFALAGVFIVQLAIESGWFNPLRQWAALTLFGSALVAVGLFVDKIDRNYRSYAAVAGNIILYFAAYSGHLYFDLFQSEVSIGLGALVSVLSFYLFHYFKSEVFTMICIVGTYLSPILLTKEADLIYLSSFFLIWACIFSTLSTYFKDRTITLLAAYMGLGIFTYLNQNVYDHDLLQLIIIVQSMQFVIYAVGVYHYSVRNQTHLTQKEAIAYLPILLFFYATIFYFLNLYNPAIAPWICLGFAAFLFLLYWQASRKIQDIKSKELVHSFLAVVIFHSGYLQILPEEGKPWLLPLIIFALFISESKNKMPALSRPLKVLFSTIAFIEFLSLCLKLIDSTDMKNIIPAAATVILGMIYYLSDGKETKRSEAFFLAFIHILSVFALYRLAYDFGSLAVSLAWAVYAFLILCIGFAKKNSIVAKSSLLVFLTATFKALIYDASHVSSGERILCLILTGGALYIAGFLFQKINGWNNATKGAN